jgi:aryl-alcohol dehydrogenase-like predicted oxidoreductase
MKHRKLGNTGLSVSEIGFGAWGIGGTQGNVPGYGPTDDAESINALKRAFDSGITFYDTADLYGDGHSESLIGAAFQAVRDKVVIASKVGFINQTGEQDFSKKHLETAIEASLKRLHTDHIDLYQLHSPPLSLLEEQRDVIEFLCRVQKEGKIRAFGIAVSSPDDGLVAIQKFGFKAIQTNFNAIDQRALTNGLFELCEKENVGMIARTPLCYGFLTGKYSTEGFHAKDHRGQKSAEQLKLWVNAHHLFEAMIQKDKRQTSGQFAIRYFLSYPVVSTTIPGMLQAEHVDENVGASDLGLLSDEDRTHIEQIYKENTFFLKAS